MGEKPSEYCTLFAFADDGNRTRDVSAASESAKRYFIASRLLTDHGSDDEGDAAEEVDPAVQLDRLF